MDICRGLMTIVGRAIKSRTFIVSVFLIFMFRLLGLLPMLICWGINPDGSFKLSGNVLNWYEVSVSSFFILIIMVVPVLPYCSAFCDDYKTNYLTYVLNRMGKSMYSAGTIIACSVSSFLCVFLGDILLVMVLGCFIPLYDVERYMTMQAITLLFMKLFLLGLQGAFHSIVAMTLSVFTLNKFIIYTSPLVLFFFFMFFGESVLHINAKINPSYIYDHYIFGEGREVESVIYALVYLLITMFIAKRLLDKKIERCY